jgi:hypothetical protein
LGAFFPRALLGFFTGRRSHLGLNKIPERTASGIDQALKGTSSEVTAN